ncbi:hypothetical protein GALMADRAFT_143500 [Galerina marginata CBS 339.88]|uniref:Uncharacterized protein n=1 Tax=Galerina marginata (strain CBS 339.88) TaxID=685588 RepID=A0A067SY49_GALM3|nr:hypothetical protein GALMADRAFT_143500 [Galerina marginata CBS 339.88]
MNSENWRRKVASKVASWNSPVSDLSAFKAQFQRIDNKQGGRADELKQAAEFRDPVGSGIPQIIALLSDSSPLVRKAAADSVAQLSEQVSTVYYRPPQRQGRGGSTRWFTIVADFFESIQDAMPQIVELLNSSDKRTRTAGASLVMNLSKQVDICAMHGIYTVLLPTTEGTSPTVPPSSTLLWNNEDFQDRVVWLWGELAKHYKHHKHITGYKALSVPTDAVHNRVIAFYDAVHSAIRSFDPHHAIFFDGNTFASDLTGMRRMRLIRRGCSNINWISTKRYILHSIIYFYPTHTRRPSQDSFSWSICLYTHKHRLPRNGAALPPTLYMTHFCTFLAKKHRLAIDACGADPSAVSHIYQPLYEHIQKKYPNVFKTCTRTRNGPTPTSSPSSSRST